MADDISEFEFSDGECLLFMEKRDGLSTGVQYLINLNLNDDLTEGEVYIFKEPEFRKFIGACLLLLLSKPDENPANAKNKTNFINIIQIFWHNIFNDEYVPSEKIITKMVDYGGSPFSVIDAIEVCAEKTEMRSKSFDHRIAYVFGVLRNTRDENRRELFPGIIRGRYGW